jgi:hypothetical protein
MKKIIIFRSVRPELMEIVVKNVSNRFGDNINVSVITRPENQFIMERIPGVNKVVNYSGGSFKVDKLLVNEIKNLKKINYDIAIIPTSGNLDTYDNVIDFKKKLFGVIPTYYYQFGKGFTIYKVSISRLIIKMSVRIIATILTVPFFIVYIVNSLFLRIIKNIK